MNRSTAGRRLRTVVCGTKFGRVYLAGLADHPEVQLTGILARGGQRSKACAEHYGVPLYTEPDQLPDDTDLACVVVGTAINGGPGAQLSQHLLRRGIHVLQEHPLHPDELTACLRAAREGGVLYRVNTHYPHLTPVRRFLAAAEELRTRQQPLFVDGMAGFPVGCSLLDLAARAVGRQRPFALDPPASTQADDRPYTAVSGTLGGIPATLRLQNELDPSDPDNHSHLLHRLTVGTEGGVLTLVGTHGPVVWSPRPHLPSAAAEAAVLRAPEDPRTTEPSGLVLGPATAPSYDEVLESVWPRGVARAVHEMAQSVRTGQQAAQHGQYQLTLARMWLDVTTHLGPPRLREQPEPAVLPTAPLATAAARIDEENT